MTARLSDATLVKLRPDIRRPRYDRRQLQPGVVHLGLGAFQRAHQAPIYERLAEIGDLRWGVIGASLRSSAVHRALSPQDGLYSLTIQGGEHRETSVVGALLDVIVASEDPHRLIEAIASPQTQLVTATVTEKGYRLDPSSGLLIDDDPDVHADLASLSRPSTVPGFLAAALRIRRDRGLAPITIASCDNMNDNGRKLRAAVARIARSHDGNLGDWIEQSCAFPNSMVDRIVPTATDADIAAAQTHLGLLDCSPVRAEPFSQWVIEDSLTGPVGSLGKAGVQITTDLGPWERTKLRMLNGAHSAMAYLGGLAGFEAVDQFVAWPPGEQFVEMLWNEVEPTIAPPAELNVAEYRNALMRRFKNSALGHRLRQIAMDGSQKLPPRLLSPASELAQRGEPADTIALAVAAWMRWQAGRTDAGASFEVDDPSASRTAHLIAAKNDPADYAKALFSIHSIFPPRLVADGIFVGRVVDHLRNLQQLGAREMLVRFVNRSNAQVRMCQ